VLRIMAQLSDSWQWPPCRIRTMFNFDHRPVFALVGKPSVNGFGRIL
jgi:hypothetical protein